MADSNITIATLIQGDPITDIRVAFRCFFLQTANNILNLLSLISEEEGRHCKTTLIEVLIIARQHFGKEEVEMMFDRLLTARKKRIETIEKSKEKTNE